MSTEFTPSLTDPPFVTPAWTLVEELPERGEDSDEWDEDEVSYVTLDFGRHMKPEGYHHVQEVQLTNINTPRPYARLGGQVFRGQHEHLIGSEILLHHNDTTYASDPSTSAYSPFATTSSRIVFHPILLGGITVGNGTTRAQGSKGKGKGKGKPTVPVVGKPKGKVGRPKGSKNRPKAADTDEPATTPPSPEERKTRGSYKKQAEDRIIPGTSRSPATLLTVSSEAGPSSAPGPSPLGWKGSESCMDDDDGEGGGEGGESSHDGYQEDEMDIG